MTSNTSSSPSFILVNGRIYTSLDDRKIHSALAVSVGGLFLMVGTNHEVISAYPNVQRIDLGGKAVYPGFIDSHAHLLEQGNFMCEVDLCNSLSPEEIVRRLQSFVAKNKHDAKEWIRGFGWDQNLFHDKKFPHLRVLDEAFPNTPVWLTRIDGHAVWVNSAGLRAAGGSTLPNENPLGGSILRDEHDKPTGVLLDNAINLIEQPSLSRHQQKERIFMAARECIKHGITSIQDAHISWEVIDIIKDNIEQLPIRVYGMVNEPNNNTKTISASSIPTKIIDYGDKLTVRSAKMFLDGALGSAGAALFEPYEDDPNNSGFLLLSPEDYYNQVKQWIQAGFQVNTHAIGDKANFVAVDTYRRVIEELGLQDKDLRLRVEHAQIIRPEDIPIFKKYNIIASVQPTHATSDMKFAEQRLGPQRVKNAYLWRTLIDKGIHVMFGSDFPIEKVNPLLGVVAAMTRQDLEGHPPGGWFASECVSFYESLQGFTIKAAYGAFQEHKLGSISVGKLADFVIFERDLQSVHPLKIPHVPLVATYLGGKLVYKSKESKL